MDESQRTIKKENDFVKIFTGGTAHARKILTTNDIYKIAGVEVQVPIIKQPVCEHCERIVIWDWTRDQFGREIPLGVCKHCGTITKNPMTYGEYLANGYDIPESVKGSDREQSMYARTLLNMMFNISGRNGIEIKD